MLELFNCSCCSCAGPVEASPRELAAGTKKADSWQLWTRSSWRVFVAHNRTRLPRHLGSSGTSTSSTSTSVASQANPAGTMRKFLGLHHRESFGERVAGRRLLALRNRLQGPYQYQHQHTTLTTRRCLLTRLFIGFIHLPGKEALWRMLLRSADEVKTLWALSGKKVWSYWHQALRQMR